MQQQLKAKGVSVCRPASFLNSYCDASVFAVDRLWGWQKFLSIILLWDFCDPISKINK